MKFRGKKVLGASKASYNFVLELEDGSRVELGPDDLPRHTYKWLYQKINKIQPEKKDRSRMV